jgi:hypothetical protein
LETDAAHHAARGLFETLFASLTTSTENVQPRLEPVQVAGFTQLLFGGTADRATVQGLAVDQELSMNVFVGYQANSRVTDRPVVDVAGVTGLVTLRERAQEAYLYWLPLDELSITARYEHGRYGSEPIPLLGYSQMKMERLPVEIRYFARGGITVGGRLSYVEQSGEFQTGFAPTPFDPPPFGFGEDRFYTIDAFVGYRLPNRRGPLSRPADNLLDESFQFQDVDPTNPSLFPNVLYLPLHACVRIDSGKAIPKRQQMSCEPLQFLGASSSPPNNDKEVAGLIPDAIPPRRRTRGPKSPRCSTSTRQIDAPP